MDIHVVQPGDTLYRLAQQYGVSMDRLLQDNMLPDPSQLVVGQTILVRCPELTHTVRAGDSLWSIAQTYRTTAKQLFRNNPSLRGRDLIFPGQVLVIRYLDEAGSELAVNAYAYPSIGRELLQATLPYLSQLTPFTYRFTWDGQLIPPQSAPLVTAALSCRVAPLLNLSNLDEREQFSPELAHALLSGSATREKLISAILEEVGRGGYRGVDIDFEYVYGQDSGLYTQFLGMLRQALAAKGLPLSAALAAKTADDQPGRLVEGLDYGAIAQNVDRALLMTYDWGWIGGPPMAIAPLPEVRRVVEYALQYFSPGQLCLGIPNYGYDWTLPFREGGRARSINNVEAVRLAWDRRQAIRFDETARAPWFRYVDTSGAEHEVWFEDARSIQAKLDLAQEYGLYGVSYWNLDRPFPQNWVVLDATAKIRPGM